MGIERYRTAIGAGAWPSDPIGLFLGILFVLAGAVTIWRPADVVRMNRKYTPKFLDKLYNWDDDQAEYLWLIRGSGVVLMLGGLFILGDAWNVW